jgi:hypothetical protein
VILGHFRAYRNETFTRGLKIYFPKLFYVIVRNTSEEPSEGGRTLIKSKCGVLPWLILNGLRIDFRGFGGLSV